MLSAIKPGEDLDLYWAQISFDATGDRLIQLVEQTSLFALRVCQYNEESEQGPSGLLLATKDGTES